LRVCKCDNQQKAPTRHHGHGAFCVEQCYHCIMTDMDLAKQRGWAFPLENIASIIVAAPVTFLLLIMGTFASDAGPSTASTVLSLVMIAVPASVIGCAILSQVKRSRRWAYIGFWIPVIVIVLFIAYVFVDDYYINPRLGPLAE